ncbi:MAG: ABC transporter permease [Erysipelotrichaceae bacterium]|nr:ABC transporter permease [Erysipelotrichaceae bacterium]
MSNSVKNNPVVKAILGSSRILVLLILAVFFTITTKGTFFSYKNLVNILYSVSLIGIMICGACFAVLLGGIDRTVSGNAALSGAIVAMTILNKGVGGSNVALAIFLGLGAGVLSGLIHGLILSRFNIPAFLLTLATNEVLYGFVQLVTSNTLIYVNGCTLMDYIGQVRWLGIPIPVYIMLACILFAYVILNHTVYGRQVYSVGGNRQSSELSGVPARKVILIAYIISGFMGALAGFVLSSMNQQASAGQAKNYENNVLAAIVVGGVSMRGGSGSIQNAILGAFLIGVIENGMNLMGVPSIYKDMAKGIIIIVAVAMDMANQPGTPLNNLKRRLTKKAA